MLINSYCSMLTELALLQQTAALKSYDAPFSLTTLMCFIGTLQAVVVTFAMERKLSVWSIGWDMNLLATAYAVRLALFFFSLQN